MAPLETSSGDTATPMGGCFGDTHLELHQEKASVIPNLMADEGLRIGEEEAETSSKEGDESHEGWLELGISGRSSGGRDAPIDPMNGVARRREEVMELNLFPNRPPDPHPILRQPIPMSAMVPRLPAALARGLGYRWEGPWGSRSRYPGWGYRWEASWGSQSQNPMATTSVPPPPMTTDYNFGQFGCPPWISGTTVRSGDDMRVVRPPPRPQIGVWFMLEAAQNQVKEPFLPQIPKSYLRIRDGRMTIRLMMKYLANKLGLDDESEVEITCRGQQLPHFLTLQFVRDNIWCSSEAGALLSESPDIEQVMILQYSRRA